MSAALLAVLPGAVSGPGETALERSFADPPDDCRVMMRWWWFEATVREASVVYVNDRRAGPVWCRLYGLDATAMLKPGDNRIRVLVANTAVNHMAGRAPPGYRLLNFRYGKSFDPQDIDRIKPVDSGLLGPVVLAVGSR
jgi:hypothetical protein